MDNKKISVLVFSGYYLPGFKGGGPIKTIRNLIGEVGDKILFHLVTSDRDLGDNHSYTMVQSDCWIALDKVRVFYSSPGLKGCYQVLKIIKENRFDLIYLNSFFSIRFSFFPLLLSRLYRSKIILSPRGEFSSGAIAIRPLKKRIFIRVFKAFRLHNETVFQASTNFEAQDILSVLGPKVDVKIAENIGSQEFIQTLPTCNDGQLRIVFISRISSKKNLLFALEALKSVKYPVFYHIYGPIEDQEYWKQCRNVIKSLPSHIQVEHKGILSPSEVVQTLANYDVFLFPTKGENYGHVIAEALCAGLPILISDATPWRDLEKAGIGWDLPLSNPNAFSSVLDELAAMPANEYSRIRRNVLAWAKNKFSQRDAIEANIEMFRYAYEKK